MNMQTTQSAQTIHATQTTLDEIAAQATSGDIVFSTHAEIALGVQKRLEDPDCTVEQLGKLISADPLLAARTLSVANSVAFNPGGRAITDLKTAVSRLGFSALRALTASVIVRQMAATPLSAEQKALSATLWEHTANVAALARVIAKHVTRQPPDTAFMAGIVHEIGNFYLITQAGTHPGLLKSDLAAWHEDGEARVGRAILGALEIPPSIMDALETLWSGYLALPPTSLGDTLLLADEVSPVESPLATLMGMSREGMPAEIELLVDEETLSHILAESADEVSSLTNALKH